jgi:hypothetical protein
LTQRAFPKNEKEQFRKLRLPMGPFSQTVNDVCKQCNEGWLNKTVEQGAESALFPLILGEGLNLTLEQTAALALWAAKTAAVRALVDSQPRAIPPLHYEWLMQTHTPPPHTDVWLARSEFLSSTFTRHQRFFFEVRADETSMHLTTFIIGHVAFFVLGCGTEVGSALLEPVISEFDFHPILRLWPNGRVGDISNLPFFNVAKLVDLSGLDNGPNSAHPLSMHANKN